MPRYPTCCCIAAKRRYVPTGDIRNEGGYLFGQRIALHKALYLTFAPLIILLGDDVAHQRYALVTDSKVLGTGNQICYIMLGLLTEAATRFRHGGLRTSCGSILVPEPSKYRPH